MGDGDGARLRGAGTASRERRLILPSADAELLALALLGSRTGGFNHDLASKLQSLLMAMDELEELVAQRGDGELTSVVEGARAAADELAGLLTQSRALVRATPGRSRIAELLRLAAKQAGVALVGALDEELAIEGPLSTLTQAFALVLDVAGGPGRGRSVALGCEAAGERCVLRVTCAVAPAARGEVLLGIARGALAASGGALAVDDLVVTIELTIAR